METRNQNSKFGISSLKKSAAVAGVLFVTTLSSAFAAGMAPAQAGYDDGYYGYDEYPSYQYQVASSRRAPVRTVRVTAPTAVIIRSGPGLDYERIGRIPNGHYVKVSYSSGKWAKLVSGPGWIHSDYISGSTGGRVYTVRVNAPVGVVIRSGPGSDYARIGSIRHGQYVRVSYSSGDWVKLVGQRGWVHADYLD
ncbi:SH3 domain-containing protein [Scytonema sp. UIC 10036]|uniref:SH3 domain-containing protein n=1 Tax=Scytonema sp. UIC 10036 TaxID=2304196 RepID=UPI00140F548A|nr:SH3 domain-containing protein [Scytonema sp. UIC 10036]